MAFIVVYDANVLYPNTLRDLLIRIAQFPHLVQAKWTDKILDEALDAVRKNLPDISVKACSVAAPATSTDQACGRSFLGTTYVPRPTIVRISPRSRSSAVARRIVSYATPYSLAMSRSAGSFAPGARSPEAMRSAM